MKFKALIITLITALVFTLVPSTTYNTEEKEENVELLDAPAVKTTMKSTKKVVVSWNKVEKAKGYVVYQSNKYGTMLKTSAVLGSAKKTKKSIKVKPGKTKYYTVKAYNTKAGKKVVGEASKVVKVKTPKLLTQKSKGFKQTNAYKVIRAARSKLGKSYVWGAAGPNSFDCSGYVYYIMNKTGLVKSIKTTKFGRSSAKGEYNQLRKYNIGSKSLSKAQPGDIVFFSRSGSTSSIHHVGIYYGGGKIIHASEPKTGVIITGKQTRKDAAIVRLPKL